MNTELKLSCLGFYQTYSVLILGSKKSDSTYIKREGAACFADAFRFVRNTKHTKVKAVKLRVLIGVDFRANTDRNLDNLCILTREEIYQWLDELSILFSKNSLSYKIFEKKINGIGFIEVVIKAYNLPTYYIKWLLTYIRLLSEGPCNWVLKEVFTLKQKIEEFKELPLLSIFVFVWSFIGSKHAFSVSTIRDCFIPNSFEELKNALHEIPVNEYAVDSWFTKNFKIVRIPEDLLFYDDEILSRFRNQKIVNQEILKGEISEGALDRYIKFLNLIKQGKTK